MKQIPHAAAISILLLLITSHASSARLLSPQQGSNQGAKPQEMTMEDDFPYLMGLEQCGEKDEACLRRRMVTEAHLDYIYTQRQQNP